MSGVVHFKFKSSTAYDSVGFDGAFISVAELKALIAEKKGLSKDATSELLLSDPRTQREYSDEAAMVPKSSSVLVRRVPNLPAAHLQQQQQPQPATTDNAPASKALVVINQDAPAQEPAPAGEEDFGGDLYSEQKDEDAALTQLLNQAGQNWEKEVKSTNPWGRGRGRGRDGRARGFGGRGRGREAEPIVLPKGYICYRCGQQGHHISDCPTNTDPDFKRIRPAVGIPSVLLTKDKGGGLLLPDGTTGSLQPNEDAFLRETSGMPGAKPKTANGAEAPEGKPLIPKEAESGDKAMVVYSEAGPALAGDSLALPMEAPGLLLPPNAGMMPWDAPGLPPFLPGMSLPGIGLTGDQPLSKEEFMRMKAGLKRKQDSSRRRSSSPSRSRSRSRHSDRRRRGRDSRSPRRRDSPRRGYRHKRHRSRDRSLSRERRVYNPARRRSPSPGFIQLRKRSRSPGMRQTRPHSPSDIIQLRRRGSHSPPHRRPKPADLERWDPGDLDKPNDMDFASSRGTFGDALEPHFSDNFETTRPNLRPAAAPKHPMSRREVEKAAAKSSTFRAPELLDEAGPFFDEPVGREAQPKPQQHGATQPDESRDGDLQEQKSKVEEAGRGVQQLGANQHAEVMPQGLGKELEKRASNAKEPGKPNDSDKADWDDMESKPKPSLLPKTFSIPVEEDQKGKRGKTAKKEKKDKDKDKTRSRKQHRKEISSPVEQTKALDAERADKQDRTGAEAVEANGEASKATKSENIRSKGSHGSLFMKAMTGVSGTKRPATKTAAPEAETNRLSTPQTSTQEEAPEAAVQGIPEEGDGGKPALKEGEDNKRTKREHKHKHKSKKRHKEKRSKQEE